MKQFEAQANKLRDLINVSTPAIAVCGISGLGKTQMIRSVCREFLHTVWIDYDFSLYKNFKDNFWYSLIDKAKQKNLEIPTRESCLNREDEIFYLISNIAKESEVIFSFENIEDATSTDLAFIVRLLEGNGCFYSVCIIIEEDIDAREKSNYSKIAGRVLFEPIQIERYSKEDILQYVCEKTSSSAINADIADINRIYETAQGSLSIVNIIINELRCKNLAKKIEDTFVISKLPDDFLVEGIKNYIINRFESLEEEYKTLLVKTSCIGMTFNVNDANKIFSFARAYDIFQNIQDASHLILQIEESEFKFESKEVHSFISKNVGVYCDKATVIKACAEYYSSSLTEKLKSENYKKYCRNLMISKELYAAINDISSMLACYRLLINNKIDSRSFSDVKELCHEYESFCSDDNLNYYNRLQLLESLIELEEFSKAQDLIAELKKESVSFPANLEYYSAIAYYGVSDGITALDVLLKNINIIDRNSDALLYAKELRLISSVYDFYDDWENQLKYFNMALSICKEHNFEREYYSLLRQSGMVYVADIAMKLCAASEDYFKKCGDIKELAKVRHNIATDAMYTLKLDIAKTKCLESIENFKSISSQGVSNGLNQEGILICLINKRYDEAIFKFLESARLNNDKFMKCTAYLNASTAYRRLDNIENYEKYLKMSKDLNNSLMPVITVTEKICELLYFFQLQDKEECTKLINSFAEVDQYVEYRHKLVIKKVIEELSLNSDYTFSDKQVVMTNFINSQCTEYIEKCLKEKCYWATTRFWEN